MTKGMWYPMGGKGGIPSDCFTTDVEGTRRIKVEFDGITAAQNLGNGEGVYAGKDGAVLNFKSLVESDNITITSTAEEITFTVTGLPYDATFATESEIYALDPTMYINQTMWAKDTKSAYRALSSDITGALTDVWQKLTVVYDAPTDTFKTPATQDGFTGDINQEIMFSAINNSITSVVAQTPKVFGSLGSVAGDEQFQSVILVAADDIALAQTFGINTTDAAAGGKTKIVTFGKVNDVNTSAWSVNDALYVDPLVAGNLTNILPSVNARIVAQVLKVGTTEGILFVNTISNKPLSSVFTPVGFDRYWFTADVIDLAGTDFYEAFRSDQGLTLEAMEQAVVPDDTKVGLTQDHISTPFSVGEAIPPLEYRGQIEFTVNNTGAGERLYFEIYNADPDGNVIDSGLASQTIGDLGVKTVFVMQTALLDSQAGATTFAETVGAATEEFMIDAGNRMRVHIVCEKVGTVGASKTFTVYFGSDHLTYIDAPQRLDTDDILNESSVDGATATNALDNVLQSGESWVEGNHKKNKVYTENGYLGHPLFDTTDHLEPQTIGAPEGSVDTLAFPTASDTSVVKMVHKITITEDCFTQAIQVMAPSWDGDSVSRITILNTTTNEARIVDNPILESEIFTTLSAGSAILLVGTELEVWFEFYNASAANAIDGGWVSNLGTGAPASTVFNIDNLVTPTVVEISHTDLDAGDRGTELDGVVSGSIIRFTETADVGRNIEFTVDTVDTVSATSTKYTVLVGSINNGSKAIRSGNTCTVHIDVPITQPTEYGVKSGYYPAGNPSWATITTELYYDNVLQAGSVDAYPINLICQKAFISPDWFYMSIPSSGGSSGGSSTFIGQTDTPSSYTGEALKLLQVNATEDGVGFVNASPPSLQTLQDTYDASNPSQINVEDTTIGEVIFADSLTDQESFLFSATGEALIRVFGVRGNGSITRRAFTTAERDAEIINPFFGDTIFNGDRRVDETWDGDVWLSSNVVKKYNNTGGGVVLGDVVIQSTSVDNAVTITNTSGNVNWPAVVVDGGAFGEFITIAKSGVHPVLIGAQSYSRGDRLTTRAVAKEGQLTNGGLVGVWGVSVKAGSHGSATLVDCQIGVNAELT